MPPLGWGNQPSDPVGENVTAFQDPGLAGAPAPGPPIGLWCVGTLHILVAHGPAPGPQYGTVQIAQLVKDGGENSLVAPSVRSGYPAQPARAGLGAVPAHTWPGRGGDSGAYPILPPCLLYPSEKSRLAEPKSDPRGRVQVTGDCWAFDPASQR